MLIAGAFGRIANTGLAYVAVKLPTVTDVDPVGVQWRVHVDDSVEVPRKGAWTKAQVGTVLPDGQLREKRDLEATGNLQPPMLRLFRHAADRPRELPSFGRPFSGDVVRLTSRGAVVRVKTGARGRAWKFFEGLLPWSEIAQSQPIFTRGGEGATPTEPRFAAVTVWIDEISKRGTRVVFACRSRLPSSQENSGSEAAPPASSDAAAAIAPPRAEPAQTPDLQPPAKAKLKLPPIPGAKPPGSPDAKPPAKPEPKPPAKPDPEAKPDPTPRAKPDPQTQAKPDPKPQAEPRSRTQAPSEEWLRARVVEVEEGGVYVEVLPRGTLPRAYVAAASTRYGFAGNCSDEFELGQVVSVREQAPPWPSGAPRLSMKAPLCQEFRELAPASVLQAWVADYSDADLLVTVELPAGKQNGRAPCTAYGVLPRAASGLKPRRHTIGSPLNVRFQGVDAETSMLKVQAAS